MELVIGGVHPQSAKQLVVNAVLRRKIGGGPCAQGLAELSIFFACIYFDMIIKINLLVFLQ